MIQKKKRGGTVVGPSHDNGGVKFVVEDNGRIVEEEGREINVPVEIADSDHVYEFKGTNKQVINKILSLGGLKVSDKVTSVKSGDIVICIKSAEDSQVRTYKGTPKQILSAINTSQGCNHIQSGAKVKRHRKGGKIWGDFSDYYMTNGALILGGF